MRRRQRQTNQYARIVLVTLPEKTDDVPRLWVVAHLPSGRCKNWTPLLAVFSENIPRFQGGMEAPHDLIGHVCLAVLTAHGSDSAAAGPVPGP